LSPRDNSRKQTADIVQVVEYLTYQLLTQYGNNTEVKTALDKYDFYIIPFVNPDGFVYTQTNNRLWRKNRQTRSGASCVGTDMNRNWPYKWEVAGGASTNPCDETYKGAAAGDTPEIKALMAFTQTLTNGKGIKLFIDWHSYGHYILIPYGYNCEAKAPNHARQLSLAQGLSTRIAKSYGTRFTTGQACAALYATVSLVQHADRIELTGSPQTGDSTDYLTDVAKAEFAWTIELRPGSSASNGFVLPAAQILPSSIEQWEGLKYLLANV
jgi:murein tripeptide amidase MpaA